MLTLTRESVSFVPNQFKIDCELDSARSIKTFVLNDSSIFLNGKLTAPNITEDDISFQKRALEEIFSQNFSGLTNFTIENKDGRIVVKSKKLSDRIFTFSNSLGLSAATAKKLDCLCSEIESKKNTNLIFSHTSIHNITQLENIPKTNRKLTALFLGLLALGFLAGIIGIGALLPQLGVINSSMGISGIPLDWAIGLVSTGVATLASIVTLKIASKKSNIAREYLKDILKMKGQMFLEGNGNDFTNGCLFLLLALSIGFEGFDTLKGCLAYPTGILLMCSALYQAIQSIKNLKNSKQTKDKELFIKSILSLCFSLSLFSLGVLTTIGMTNTPIQTIFMFTTGTLMLTLAGFGMKKSIGMLKAVNEVDPNNAKSILNFLQNNLSLNDEEIKKINNFTSKLKVEDILDWISKNNKNWDLEQQRIWNDIAEKLKTKKDIEIDEIKKLITNEEIKNTIEKKLDSFRSLVSEDTYKNALNALQNAKDNSCINEKELKDIFIKIRRQIRIKTTVETIKFFFLFIPYMIVPALNMNGLLSIRVYDSLIAALNFLSLSINSTPRFRNVPPALDKKPLDINEKIGKYNDLKLNADLREKIALKKIIQVQKQRLDVAI